MPHRTLPFRLRTALSRQFICLCFAGSLALAACGEAPANPQPLYPDDIRNDVVPELVASFGPEGRFVLPAPPPGAFPQLTPEQAAEMAVVFARTFGPYIRGYLETDHGRSIDFEALRVGSPVYYSATPYEPPPADVNPALRNLTGPSYLVYLVSPEGTPVLMVSMAAYTEVRVEAGRLRFPREYGNDFEAHGVPLGRGFVMPVSPERAVEIVARATGGRAASVPELVMADLDYMPVHSRWKVTLDRAVSARGRSGRMRPVREVYVGLRSELTIPLEDQPQERMVFDSRANRSVRLSVRPGRPVAFEPVTLSAQ